MIMKPIESKCWNRPLPKHGKTGLEKMLTKCWRLLATTLYSCQSTITWRSLRSILRLGMMKIGICSKTQQTQGKCYNGSKLSWKNHSKVVSSHTSSATFRPTTTWTHGRSGTTQSLIDSPIPSGGNSTATPTTIIWALTTVWKISLSWLITILLLPAWQLMTFECLVTEFLTLILILFKLMIFTSSGLTWENTKRKKTVQSSNFSIALNKLMAWVTWDLSLEWRYLWRNSKVIRPLK